MVNGWTIVAWLVFAAIAGYIGHIKHRPVLGLVLGFLIGIFGILVIAIVPAKRPEQIPPPPSYYDPPRI